jgi:putative hemolysin
VNFELLGLAVALFLSAFCSGSEIAFTALNPAHVLLWKKEKKFGARRTQAWSEAPDAFLIAVLVGTNLANIAFTSLATLYLLTHPFPEWAIFPLITVIVLLFGELLPKLIFHALRHELFPLMMLPVVVLRFFILPLVWPFELFVRVLGSNKMDLPLISLRGHLAQLFHQAGDTGLIGQQESELIEKALALKETRLSDVMTPRVDLCALPIESRIEDLEAAAKSGFSKIPVYRGSVDTIIGYVALRDLFANPKSLEDILRPISFFPKTTLLSWLLSDAGRSRWKMAVVLDEYGGTAGLVTLEDLIEEVVGEIEDEHDTPAPRLTPLQNGRIALNARISPDEVFAIYKLPQPRSSYETMGGWLIDAVGRIPMAGESFKRDGLRVEVVAATKKSVTQLICEKESGP